MSQETQQRTIFGEPIDEQLSIETTGRTIRPIRRMFGHIAAEYKLRFNEDGLHVRVVDPSNVIMIRLDVPREAFDDYWTDGEYTTAINNDTFGGMLQHARYGKSTDDPVFLSGDAEHLESETHRDLAGTTAVVTERAATFDPDSVRSEPDLPNIEFDVEVELEPQAFIEAIELFDTTGNAKALKLGSSNDSVILQQTGDVQKRNVELDADPTGVSEWSMYSAPFVKRIANVLNDGYADSLRLKWSEEFPVFAEFEREGVYNGTVMLAPRVEA